MPNPLHARLGKLAPSLSAKERFLLVLQAHNAGEPEDPEVRRTMPPGQRKEFNRYAHLVYAANAQLWPMLVALSALLDNMEYAYERFGLLEKGAAQLEEAHAAQLAKDAAEGGYTVPMFLRELQGELETSIRHELSLRWRELRALEIVWAEVDAECDGEPATEQQVRDRAGKTKARLKALAEQLASKGPKPRLPEPAPEFVDQVRAVLHSAYTQHGWAVDETPSKSTRRNSHGR